MTEIFRVICALTALPLASACQPGLKPVVPAGQAGYEAIAIPSANFENTIYRLQPGDEISVYVYEEDQLSRENMRIDAGGSINLPLVGEVAASGRSATELASYIEQQYRNGYLRKPRVSVSIGETRPRSITVEGEVELPGVYAYDDGHTLLKALAQAQSPTDTAELDEVLIFRQIDRQRVGAQFDVIAIRSGRMDDPQVLPGDVIVVGYSSLRGTYKDILQTAPLIGVFRPF